MRTTRNFPQEAQPLSVEINRAYVDTANFVNARIIGLYPPNKPMITGESWFISGQVQKQQSLRQLFTFTGTGSIAHGITAGSISQISPNSYGQYTDGTNWYGVIFASSTTIAGQVSFYVSSSSIVVIADTGAPAITFGFVNLEWITNALNNSF